MAMGNHELKAVQQNLEPDKRILGALQVNRAAAIAS